MGDVVKVESLDSLLETIVSNTNVVVVFSAMDWCINCKRLAPHIEALAKELDDFLFLEVDVDHVAGVKEHFELMSVPQIWYYEDAFNGSEARQIKASNALLIRRALKS